VLVAGTAHAAISTIGEFTGDATETFENIGPPQPYPGGMSIFGGDAVFNDTFTNAPWITPNLTDFSNELFAYDGAFMGLAPTGVVTFQFDTPILQFGGFFGHLSQGVSGGSISFLDDEGATIETLPFDLGYNQWSWFGWESDTPISGIAMSTGANPGFTTVYDNLQISHVPAPGALALLAIGGCMCRRRRG
jgi:hypothetical protein